jgi:hypothetical protein
MLPLTPRLQLFAPSLPSSLDLLQSVEGRQQVMAAAGLGDKCYCRWAWLMGVLGVGAVCGFVHGL